MYYLEVFILFFSFFVSSVFSLTLIFLSFAWCVFCGSRLFLRCSLSACFAFLYFCLCVFLLDWSFGNISFNESVASGLCWALDFVACVASWSGWLED